MCRSSHGVDGANAGADGVLYTGCFFKVGGVVYNRARSYLKDGDIVRAADIQGFGKETCKC